MIILNFVQRKQRCAPPAEASFSRLPRMAQSAYIARAQALGVDPVSLFMSEQQRLLDKMNISPVFCEQNLDNCTETTQFADHMPFTEGADEMLKRQKFTINGQQRYASFDADQMITKSSIISEKYAQLASRSCNENCSGESA